MRIDTLYMAEGNVHIAGLRAINVCVSVAKFKEILQQQRVASHHFQNVPSFITNSTNTHKPKQKCQSVVFVVDGAAVVVVVIVVEMVIKAKYVIAVVFVINKNGMERTGKRIARIRYNVRDPCTRCHKYPQIHKVVCRRVSGMQFLIFRLYVE